MRPLLFEVYFNDMYVNVESIICKFTIIGNWSYCDGEEDCLQHDMDQTESWAEHGRLCEVMPFWKVKNGRIYSINGWERRNIDEERDRGAQVHSC